MTPVVLSKLSKFLTSPQACGYLASGLVLATFCMRQMIPLRVIAICSNLAFFAYGLILDLKPVALLHAMLLPVNLWRLSQMIVARYPRAAWWCFNRLSSARQFAFSAALAGLLATAVTGTVARSDIRCGMEDLAHNNPTCRMMARAEQRRLNDAALQHGTRTHQGLKNASARRHHLHARFHPRASMRASDHRRHET